MPKRNIIQVQLPIAQPDSCKDCPLLGLIPKEIKRPYRSQMTHICLGTMKALTARLSRRKASEKDARHPLHRPCDRVWKAWQTSPGMIIGINAEHYNRCRMPYIQSLQMQIDFNWKEIL